MTSSDVVQLSKSALAGMLRTLVKDAIAEGVSRARTPRVLTGSVEDINSEELDVAWVRMDLEAMASDPTQSLNFGEPGVIPAIRIGSTFTGEQVRVEFDGSAGATAFQTSAEKRILLPFGAEAGERIRLDGEVGYIAVFDTAGNLVGYWDHQQFAVGSNLGAPGDAVTVDPLGGIRLRSTNDTLVSIMDQRGYSLRDVTTGIVTAEIKPGSFRMVDPMGTDDIEMVTASTGTLPNPAYRTAPEINPGSSLVVPAAPLFTTTPADDISVGHVAAWLRATNQAATMTPPAGWTEQSDANFADAAGTLQTSTATLDPATGATGTFTSTQTNWEHALGTHVVVKGGGAVSPSFRSAAMSTVMTSESSVVLSGAKPAGVVQGDVLLTFVSLGVSGGLVPTGWVTPQGFVFLGANFSTSGSGATQSTLATGCWAKLAGASEPSTYETTINLPTGTKMVQATMVAIQSPFLVPGGVQIRMAGKPIRRLLAFTELQSASTTLCDFQNVAQGYDNLELTWDGQSNAAGGSAQQIRIRFNSDSTANYFWRYVRNGAIGGSLQDTAQGFQDTGFKAGALNGAVAGNKTGGIVNILGYARVVKQVLIAHSWWTNGLTLMDETGSGQWDGPSGSATTINRITVDMNAAGATFAAGSRAYLYGY